MEKEFEDTFYNFLDNTFWYQIDRLNKEIEDLKKSHIINLILDVIFISLILILLFLK